MYAVSQIVPLQAIILFLDFIMRGIGLGKAKKWVRVRGVHHVSACDIHAPPTSTSSTAPCFTLCFHTIQAAAVGMAVKASTRAVCLLGQHLSVTHSPTLGACRTPHLGGIRNAQAHVRPAYKEDELAAAYDIPSLSDLRKREGHGPVLTTQETEQQLDLHSPVDLLREVLLYDVVPRFRQNAIRSAAQRALSTALPTSEASATAPASPAGRPQFPLNGELIPHHVLRDALKTNPASNIKNMKWIIREQLLRCQTPHEILRVVAVAMQRKSTAAILARMHESLRRALYRSRNNVTDAEVLSTINTIVQRLKTANLPVEEDLLKLGIKFSARARSLPGMKRYLKDFRDTKGVLSRGLFRAVIAKFSIGSRGLGEIRNGRWRRKELLQVLLGFDDDQSHEQHHLGVFLQRDDWHFLHGWLTVLARCKATGEIWKEWELWLMSSVRNNPRPLRCTSRDMNTKTRGDYWFIEQMCYAGDVKRAWMMFKESGTPFSHCRQLVRDMLLNEVEHATIWDEEVRDALLKKYVSDLAKIEAALGVKWVSRGQTGGFYVIEGDLEDKLDKLAEEGFKLDPEYGYPWPEPTAAGQPNIRVNYTYNLIADTFTELNEQRRLMEAEEELPATTASSPRQACSN